ncbi:Histone-lysine N-methyltransferase SETD2 [Halotydeus destructor]|nr:Histone-lysine N-methyltransferase SETD2 [Halotydeus destructor]
MGHKKKLRRSARNKKVTENGAEACSEQDVDSRQEAATEENNNDEKDKENESQEKENIAEKVVEEPIKEPEPVVVHPEEPKIEPPKYGKIEENVYLFDRRKSKTKKDIKRMVCDCILTKEERQRKIMGCGDDCLNRMLMIECGSRCPLGDHCANKRFQQRRYSKVEPFPAGQKGFGLRTTDVVEAGEFVMEYIGEVVDPLDFKARVKKYNKEKIEHHYFMALKTDEIIDATEKGNMTRFVNHSCEPNCETQKWSVNGDLRIGFFTLRRLEKNEEVTFDYQFQRYGKEAQKCFCGSPSCRGYIGAQKASTIDIDGSRFTPKMRTKIAELDQKLKSNKEEFEDMALEEEIEKLRSVGFLRNRQQTLNLARLMIRAEDKDNRMKLLSIIKSTPEVAYLRLLLDYHGLQLLWSWMVEQEDPWLQSSILQVLEILPIPNKNILVDSKVLEIVEKWSKSSQGDVKPPSTSPFLLDEENRVSARSESIDSEPSKPSISRSETPEIKSDDSEVEAKLSSDKTSSIEKIASVESEPLTTEPHVIIKKELDDEIVQEDTDKAATDAKTEIKEEQLSSETSPTDEPKLAEKLDETVALCERKTSITPTAIPVPNIVTMALKVLALWKDLKEGFKIPRLVRQKRKDDEQEADRMARELEERTARGLPVTYGKRGPDDKEYTTIAGILRRTKKACLEKRVNGTQQYSYNYNLGEETAPREPPPPEPQGPKLSKEEHRMQFEMELMRKQYEEAMHNYQQQIAKYHVMLEQQHGSIMPMMPMMPVMDPSGASAAYAYQSSTPTTPLETPQYPTSTVDDGNYSGYSQEYSQEGVDGSQNEYENLTDDVSNFMFDSGYCKDVVIECTSDDHQLMIDEKAAISTDYGFEYVPVDLRLKTQADSVAFTGIYYEYAGQVIFAPFDSHKDSYSSDQVEFKVCLDEPLPLPIAVSTALPRYWRRAISKSKQEYFYNKKTGETRWTLPEYVIPPRSSNPESSKTTCPVQSTVSTADSTSVSQTEIENVVSSTSTPPKISPQEHNSNGSHTPEPATEINTTEVQKPAASVERDPRKRKQISKPIVEPVISQSVKSSHTTVRNKSSHKPKLSEKQKKKITDKFRLEMVTHIKKVLDSYRKPDCKVGKIISSEDYKYVAKKLSDMIVEKEIKRSKVDDLSCNEGIKQKAKEFIKKYMSTKGPIYKGLSTEKSSPIHESCNGNDVDDYSQEKCEMMIVEKTES